MWVLNNHASNILLVDKRDSKTHLLIKRVSELQLLPSGPSDIPFSIRKTQSSESFQCGLQQIIISRKKRSHFYQWGFSIHSTNESLPPSHSYQRALSYTPSVQRRFSAFLPSPEWVRASSLNLGCLSSSAGRGSRQAPSDKWMLRIPPSD